MKILQVPLGMRSNTVVRFIDNGQFNFESMTPKQVCRGWLVPRSTHVSCLNATDRKSIESLLQNYTSLNKYETKQLAYLIFSYEVGTVVSR